MKVAIVHDDLVQWGGAERVLEAISEIYPEAPIYTSVFDRANKELNSRFGSKKIVTSFLQKIPGWKNIYKALLPLYGISFEQFDFSGYDLVISHTTRFAKAVITKPETKHICYCHTPPRFLWHFSGEVNFGILESYLTKLRIYDQVIASRVDHFLAGSKNAQSRIEKIYRQKSEVVYPFVDLERFKGVEGLPDGRQGFDGGYFVVIGRSNNVMKYKKVELAIDACLKLGVPLKVIGVNPRSVKGENGVEFLWDISDAEVVQVLAGCRALIVPGVEDFGITPLEAQALGKPVIAYREGGVLETVLPGVTGVFFKDQDVESLVKVLQSFDSKKFSQEDCRRNAAKFSKEYFVRDFKEKIVGLL